MNKFYLQKNVLYLSQLLPKFPWCSGQMRFIDKSLQILLSTGWVPGLLVSIILFCYRLLQLPTAREGSVNNPKQAVKHPWNTREPPVNHPWTTREPPVIHPWITREPPVKHPWTIRETSVLETLKTGLETWKTDFVPWDPWNTREDAWSTRECSGDAQWTCINGQILSTIFEDNACLYEPSFFQNRFKTVMVLKCWQQVVIQRFREVIGERDFKWSS